MEKATSDTSAGSSDSSDFPLWMFNICTASDKFKWRDLSEMTRIMVWIFSFILAGVQLILLFVLMLESPGWVDESGRVRYISDALALHKGYGIGLVLLFFYSFLILSIGYLSRPMWYRLGVYLLFSLPVSSGFSVVMFTNVDTPVFHYSATFVLFFSYILIVSFVRATSRDSMEMFDTVLGLSTVVFVVLFISLFLWANYGCKATDKTCEVNFSSASAVFEFLTLLCCTIWNSTTPYRVRDHLLSKSEKNDIDS
jgi:hypothetical protein